nr:glutamic acid-rich protein-like [Aedes albopictus]
MEARLCRLCLAPNCGRIPLFDEMTMQPNVLMIQKVVECTSIKITAEDDYPSSICAECERKLNELSAFKIQCIVNNDFYREKQAELRRKQLACSQQPTEVVCLDDDDEEEVHYAEEEEEQGQQEKDGYFEQPDQTVQKKARIEEVVIEDDEDDYEEFNLDDFELVEGQEVDQYYQQDEPELIDNNAILTSILLDDEEDDDDAGNNALLMDQGHYEKIYPYECQFCRRRFSSLTKLESHVKSHSQNRMKCFICGRMVVVHLLRHLRTQHPGMAFPEPVRCWHSKCADLDEVFLDVTQLLAHMDTKRRRR